MPNKYFLFKSAKLTLIMAILLALILWNPGNFLSPIRIFFLEIAYPFQKAFYLTGGKIRGTTDFLSSIGKLKEENKNLIKENNSLTAQISELKDQKNENENLRRQLDLAPRGKYQLEAAMVIGQDSLGSGSWLMIDKGSNDGIEKGMPAIVFDGILVGKVAEVYQTSSKISLLTDPSNFVNVVDLETGAAGIVKGKYGLGLMMDMVEQTDSLKEGDDIITSGLGGLMPKGFLIGKIRQISDSSDKLFQQAAIVPQVKYLKLDTVFVVKKTL